ncbi:MAG: TIGR03905 family TSCPD domain-containing protein [Anaerovoracaceae bacterium]|jgi:uncharacterized protein (TIGR03905 family)
MRYVYNTQGTCSTQIAFDLNGDVVTNVVYQGGCDGNLKAIPILVDGMTVEEIEDKLKGITCGWKDTSCADQLARAVRLAYEKEKESA